MDHDHLEPPSSQVPEFRNGGEAHDDQDAYESMGGDGHFQFTSESIFNDQEYTDSPPDNDDPDFDRHEARTPVPTIAASSINQVFTIRPLPTYRPPDALNMDDSAGSSSLIPDLDIAEGMTKGEPVHTKLLRLKQYFLFACFQSIFYQLRLLYKKFHEKQC